jgi:hypothetical protein
MRITLGFDPSSGLDAAPAAEKNPLRNPVEGDHDSGAKPIRIPAGSRSLFRSEADQ